MKKLNLIGLVSVLLLSFITVQNLQAKDDDKTVTITATGSGKTQDDAKQSALRSAIEQTFGVFISSKTEIFNDQLVADEIASVANGNIQSFKILNASQLPDGNWGVTLNAVISVNKLTSFVQSKGVTVEFQGSLFAINIKQQMLNESAEYKATKQLEDILNNPLHNAFDYKIKASEPKSIDGGSNFFGIELVVSASANKNMEFCLKYLLKTLSNICLNESELSNYKSLNKKVYPLLVTDGVFNWEKDLAFENYRAIFKAQRFYFRNSESLDNIVKIFQFYNKNKNKMEQFYITSFEINSGLNRILGNEMYIRGFIANYYDRDTRNTKFKIDNNMNHNDYEEKNDGYRWKYYVYNSYFPIGYNEINCKIAGQEYPRSEKALCFPPMGKITAEFYWREKYKLNELEKLKGFSIKPISVIADKE